MRADVCVPLKDDGCQKRERLGHPSSWTVDGGDSLDQTRFSMLQAAAGTNNLGNSDHGAIVGELPVKSAMEEQAQEQTHSVFSSKATTDYHFKTGQ